MCEVKEDNEHKTQWHQAFVGAMHCELEEDLDKLDFYPERSITKKPLQIDLLVIKKKKNDKLKSRIGKLLTEYNILEYKSPDDHLGAKALFQAFTYACYYKSTFDEGECRSSNVTVMLIRNGYPGELVEYLKRRGCTVEEQEPGIYRISGDPFFNLMILASGEMKAEDYTWLNSLRRNFTKNDYKRLSDKADSIADKASLESVLNVVENIESIRQYLKEGEGMSILLQREQKGRQEGRQELIQELLELQKKGTDLNDYFKELTSQSNTSNKENK